MKVAACPFCGELSSMGHRHLPKCFFFVAKRNLSNERFNEAWLTRVDDDLKQEMAEALKEATSFFEHRRLSLTYEEYIDQYNNMKKKVNAALAKYDAEQK